MAGASDVSGQGPSRSGESAEARSVTLYLYPRDDPEHYVVGGASEVKPIHSDRFASTGRVPRTLAGYQMPWKKVMFLLLRSCAGIRRLCSFS